MKNDMRKRAIALGWNPDSIISGYLLEKSKSKTDKCRDELRIQAKNRGSKKYE